MEKKLKYQLIVHTPTAVIKSVPVEIHQEVFSELENTVHEAVAGKLEYLQFVTEANDDSVNKRYVCISKDILSKSYINIDIVE